MQPGIAQKRIAFLDTNALMDLFVYWMTCVLHALNLEQFQEFDQLRTALEANVSSFPLKGEDMDPLRRGQRLFHDMRQRSGEWDFFTSRLCLSELQRTLLEDQASQRLVASKVPYRLTRERPLIIYRRALTEQDYTALKKNVDEFFEQLELDYSVTIQIAEEGATDLRTIALVADCVLSHVLFEVMDGFIYASSVTSMADVLITRDSAFRDAVRNICTPPDQEWQAIRTSLDAAVSALQTGGFAWPEARSLRAPFP